MSHKKLHYAIEGLQSLNQTATLGLLGGLTRTTLVTCAEDGDSKVERVHDSSEEVGRFHEESSLLLVQPMDLSCEELMRMLLDINITSRTTKRCSLQKLQQQGDEADGETVLPLAIVQRITSYLTVVPVCHEDAHVVGSSSSHTMDELDQWNLDGNTTTLSKTGTMRIKGESSEWIQYSFSRNGNKVVRLASIKLLVLPPSRVPQEESLAIRNFRLQSYNVERGQWTSISPLMQIEAKTNKWQSFDLENGGVDLAQLRLVCYGNSVQASTRINAVGNRGASPVALLDRCMAYDRAGSLLIRFE